MHEETQVLPIHNLFRKTLMTKLCVHAHTRTRVRTCAHISASIHPNRLASQLKDSYRSSILTDTTGGQAQWV